MWSCMMHKLEQFSPLSRQARADGGLLWRQRGLIGRRHFARAVATEVLAEIFGDEPENVRARGRGVEIERAEETKHGKQSDPVHTSELMLGD